MTAFRSFDEQGNMIRTGRGCTGKQGVVSAGRAEAAEIGRNILAGGGNAIDAAVAVAFAMGVCEPNASGVGGGGFMLLRDGKTGKCVFLDFRENAPANATPDMSAEDLCALMIEQFSTMSFDGLTGEGMTGIPATDAI